MNTIKTEHKIPKPWTAYRSTLRLAPSVSKCILGPSASRKLSAFELDGLAKHWGNTLGLDQSSPWIWKAFQQNPQAPVVICACNVDFSETRVFENVAPELMYLFTSLKRKDSGFLISRDQYIVQSAVVTNGVIKSIRSWPAEYACERSQIVSIHKKLEPEMDSNAAMLIIESSCGDIQRHES
ncbi:MAG: hypothetical protein ACK4FF_10400 [Limnobacter sp.]|uniref:hypothetical protein n=1 Tax=Limnobacter sp. TaxID=2003368 RepID=UPI00391AAE9B